MKINDTDFGSITINGIVYGHDVIIRMSGRVEKRKKKLSKEVYGTSHILSLEEAEYIYEKGSALLIIGSGQSGKLHLSQEAAQFFTQHDCRVHAEQTPQAIKRFNETKGPKIALFHVTC